MFARYVSTNTNHPGLLETFPTSALEVPHPGNPSVPSKPYNWCQWDTRGREGKKRCTVLHWKRRNVESYLVILARTARLTVTQSQISRSSNLENGFKSLKEPARAKPTNQYPLTMNHMWTLPTSWSNLDYSLWVHIYLYSSQPELSLRKQSCCRERGIWQVLGVRNSSTKSESMLSN